MPNICACYFSLCYFENLPVLDTSVAAGNLVRSISIVAIAHRLLTKNNPDHCSFSFTNNEGIVFFKILRSIINLVVVSKVLK